MKTQLASVEIAALVNEWKSLIKAKIDQIFQPDKKNFVFRLHVPNQGKTMLRIVLGKMMFITQHKQDMSTPPPFCMRLRKHLDGGFIREINQLGSQRIVDMKVEVKGTFYHLIIELFGTGNLILLDGHRNILFPLESQSWQARDIKKGLPYEEPPMKHDWQTITVDDLKNMLHASNKDKLVTSLAVELSLGGVYSEYLCHNAGIDKEKKPTTATGGDIEKLHLALIELRQNAVGSGGVVYPSMITPFKLHTEEEPTYYFTYNDALDAVIGSKLLEHDEASDKIKDKLDRLKRIEEKQLQKVHEFERDIVDVTRKGELIYENYQHVSELFKILKEKIEKDGWESLKQADKKIIKELDLKHKRIVIELGK